MLLIAKSGNAKTGPIAVSYSPRTSCPPSCAFFRNGCYAEGIRTLTPWKRARSGMRAWIGFLAKVAKLPAGTMFRHNVAGDLPGKGEEVDPAMIAGLVGATRHLVSWTYSHKRSKLAKLAIRTANRRDGITINLSANSPADADTLASTYYGPVVTVLPGDTATKVSYTPRGRMIVTCPATYRDSVTCATCGNGRPLCMRKDRAYIVGFPAHGVSARRADAVAREFPAAMEV